MAKCPVCENEYIENQVNFCTTCGWDLTPYPKSLGMIPQAFLDKERAKIAWAREMWKKHLDNLSQSSLKLEQANHTISELQSQLERAKQINKVEYQSQLDNIYSQLKTAKDERKNMNIQLTQVNQKLAQIQLFQEKSILLESTEAINSQSSSIINHKNIIPENKRKIYQKLQELLKAQKWREADGETKNVMFRIANKTTAYIMSSEDIINFPCEDLSIINNLWLKYSNGIFGFSVQQTLYSNCGQKLDKFAQTIGCYLIDNGRAYMLEQQNPNFEDGEINSNVKGCFPWSIWNSIFYMGIHHTAIDYQAFMQKILECNL